MPNLSICFFNLLTTPNFFDQDTNNFLGFYITYFSQEKSESQTRISGQLGLLRKLLEKEKS